jgi:hypothetical protein
MLDNRSVQHVDMVLTGVFLYATILTHKNNLWKGTLLVPLCYIFSISFMLYTTIFLTCICSRFSMRVLLMHTDIIDQR